MHTHTPIGTLNQVLTATKWSRRQRTAAEKQSRARVIMNTQYRHMTWMSPSAKLRNGNGVCENGLESEGNEGVIADVWTDYSG